MTYSIQLVHAAIAGDEHAFEQLIIHESNKLYKIAYLHMQNKEDALDVVQEATDVGPEAGYSFDLFKLQDDTDDLGGTLAALTKEGDAYRLGYYLRKPQPAGFKDIADYVYVYGWCKRRMEVQCASGSLTF